MKVFPQKNPPRNGFFPLDRGMYAVYGAATFGLTKAICSSQNTPDMNWLFPVVCATMIFTASCSKNTDLPAPVDTGKVVKTQSASTSGGDSIKKIKKPVSHVRHEDL